jgi:pilus assembly protein Flp/PilA
MIKNYKHILVNLLNDESGQDLIEYALVASLIALVAVTAMTSVGTAITTAFTTIGTKITTAV